MNVCMYNDEEGGEKVRIGLGNETRREQTTTKKMSKQAGSIQTDKEMNRGQNK